MFERKADESGNTYDGDIIVFCDNCANSYDSKTGKWDSYIARRKQAGWKGVKLEEGVWRDACCQTCADELKAAYQRAYKK